MLANHPRSDRSPTHPQTSPTSSIEAPSHPSPPLPLPAPSRLPKAPSSRSIVPLLLLSIPPRIHSLDLPTKSTAPWPPIHLLPAPPPETISSEPNPSTPTTHVHFPVLPLPIGLGQAVFVPNHALVWPVPLLPR